MNLAKALAGAVRAALIGVVGIVVVSTPANATPFLEIDDIEGDSTKKGHEGWIDLLGVSWGVTASVSSTPRPGEAPPPKFEDLRWTQRPDKSTPRLFAAIAAGSVLQEATVDFTETFGHGTEEVYLQMTFRNLFLTEVSLASNGPEEPMVSASFTYTQVTMTYTEYDDNGTKKGSVSASYDLETGKGSAASLAGVFALGAAGPGTPIPTIPEPAPAPAMLVALALLGRHLQRQQERARIA